ncbi:MAG TPA: hypothetical protein VNO33_12635 [Kofleriaceae bacterium]|nr:hypothetical protein [Kofleriaceae bacterium]
MLRLILGFLKGVIIGGAVGYGAYYLGLVGVFHWITYGVIGALVGLLVGRPFWSHMFDKSSTMWTALLKGIVGYGVGVGLFALAAKVWGGFDLTIADDTRILHDWQFVLGGAIGALYGAFVEIDDAPARSEKRRTNGTSSDTKAAPAGKKPAA